MRSTQELRRQKQGDVIALWELHDLAPGIRRLN